MVAPGVPVTFYARFVNSQGDDFSNEGGCVHVPDGNHLLRKRSLATDVCFEGQIPLLRASESHTIHSFVAFCCDVICDPKIQIVPLFNLSAHLKRNSGRKSNVTWAALLCIVGPGFEMLFDF